jgi:3-oxoacyl-[acyl-carrier protein] reductase
MNLGISDRVALVTGASAGIGFAIAKEFIENHASVVIVARGAARLRAAEAALRSQTTKQVLAIVADVASPDAPQSIIDQVVFQFGQLDILVNNAGRAHAGNLLESSEQDWTEMTDTKLSATRRLCKAVIPVMRARGWGRIVNMSSIGGKYPNPKLFISQVLSAAINNFTKSLALEVAADGILVNAIGCGAIDTDNWANNMVPTVRRARPELAIYRINKCSQRYPLSLPCWPGRLLSRDCRYRSVSCVRPEWFCDRGHDRSLWWRR